MTERVEGLYTQWHLGNLVCEDDLEKYGAILEVPKQTEFYRQVEKKTNARAFVIISDALRYEAAASTAKQLHRETKSKVNLTKPSGNFPNNNKVWYGGTPAQGTQRGDPQR